MASSIKDASKSLVKRDILTPFTQVLMHKIIMPQNTDYKNSTSEDITIPAAREDNAYKKRLNG
ncbi:MAG: hypothetical protein ACK510_00555 [bacterium]